MLNIINLFKLKRDDKIKIDNSDKIRDEHYQQGFKHYNGPIF